TGAPHANPPHTFQATLTYNGTTLTEVIRDLTTNTTFSHDYLVNIPQIIGSPLAYVGFTGGTGGLNAVVDVLSWSGQFPTTQVAPTYLSASDVSQLVTHGGLETGNFSGWTLSGDPTAGTANVIARAPDGATVRSGGYAGQFGPDNLVFLTQALATTPGASYTLSFWLSNPVGGTGTEWLGRGGRNTPMAVPKPPRFNFTQLTVYL